MCRYAAHGGSASGVPGTRTMPVADADGNGVPDTNRLSSIDGVTLPAGSYDVLGNQTYLPDPLGGAFTAVYLDQGHIAKLMDGTSTEWRYYYDADGQRRIKAAGPSGLANSSFTFYAGNYLICQLDRGNQVQDPASYTPKFLLTDHLGTTRAELTFDASKTPQILKTYDYMPYGEEIAPAPSITEQVKFTGKQRDTESGLDFFGAREYSSLLCRWVSSDLPFVDNDTVDPQSWNMYSYTRNNPIVFVDEDGYKLTYVNQKVEDFFNEMAKESPLFKAEIEAAKADQMVDVTVEEVGARPIGAPGNLTAFRRKDGTVVMTIRIRVGDKSTTSHEVGHEKDARTNTNKFFSDARADKKAKGGPNEKVHDERPVEKRANKFRDQVEKERKQYEKQLKQQKQQQKKQQEQQKKKQKSSK